MGLFDFLKKKAEPVVKKAEPIMKDMGLQGFTAPQTEVQQTSVPKKPALVLNESELMEGFPRLTRFEISAMDDAYYAIMEYEDEDLSRAFYNYMELAKKGHPGAMNAVAQAYSLGDGVERDFYEYLRWTCRSASAGHEFAMIQLAEEYESGLTDYINAEDVVILEKDPVASFMWYLRASRQEIYYDEYDENEEETDEDYDDELIIPGRILHQQSYLPAYNRKKHQPEIPYY